MVWRRNRFRVKVKQCSYKVAYFSADEAMTAMQQVPTRLPTAAVYLCTVCGHYHWGNKKTEKK